jgi:8-oxo-dGTP pyrophosphatase MutT (NUDIX family)
MSLLSLTRDEIVARVRPHKPGRKTRGDHDLTPAIRPHPPLKPAAVLVGLVDWPQGMTVLLTERTQHLADHAGQISFPGGRIEPQDEGPEDAALRETEEEIGLPRDQIDLIGRLDTYETSTGYEVVPVVGLVRPPFVLLPDPHEVADVFEVPLAFILDPANHEKRSREWQGGTRHFFVLPYQQRYIWGATAGMLVNLAQVLSGE